MPDDDTGGAAPEEVEAPPPAAEDPAGERKVKHFWFIPPGGEKFQYLDLTAKEALALERRFPGHAWGNLRPSVLEHRMAMLETFLARSDPEHAADRVGAMTIPQLDDAIEIVYDEPDDLPDSYVDGLPKAGDAP